MDRNSTAAWEAAYSSIEGPRGGQNEDYVAADSGKGVFVVADGMGGRPNGSLAGRLGAETFAEKLAAYQQPGQRLDEGNILAAAQAANDAIRCRAARDEQLSGMGTTLAALLLHGANGRVVHIGDSRVYLVRDGRIQRLTRDHTVTGELVSGNHLAEEDADNHPLRHMLARSLGGGEKVDADILPVIARPGDLFLLATDGLNAVLKDADIEDILKRSKRKRAGHACGELLRASRRAGAADDISVLVVKINARRGVFTALRSLSRRFSPAPSPEPESLQLPASAWDAVGTDRVGALLEDWKKQLQELAAQKRALVDQQQKEKGELRKQYLALLDVADAFERVFANAEARKDLWTPQMKIWIGNFRTAYRLLGRFMKEHGVLPIESIDQGFDPRWHEVTCKHYDAEQPEGSIIREIRRGFVWHGELLRRAQVEVTTTDREESGCPGTE